MKVKLQTVNHLNEMQRMPLLAYRNVFLTGPDDIWPYIR